MLKEGHGGASVDDVVSLPELIVGAGDVATHDECGANEWRVGGQNRVGGRSIKRVFKRRTNEGEDGMSAVIKKYENSFRREEIVDEDEMEVRTA